MNIAFVTSQGGHSGQIKLIFNNEVIGKNNCILVTEKPNADNSIVDKNFNNKFRTYFFEKDTLLKLNPFRYLATMFNLIKIFKDEKIELIITNGAQISIPAVIAAKILRIRSIFIETVIRVQTTTWSAKACYPFVDIFLVQHPEMIAKYGRKAEYHGAII